MGPKASVMVKFCFIMLAVYIALSVFFFVTGDRDHSLMFLVGSIMWVVAGLIWVRNETHGD